MKDLHKVSGQLRSTAIALSGSVSPAGVIAGTALHFDQMNSNGWAVASGAIDAAARLPVMLWAHDDASVIGKWTSVRIIGGSLQVRGELNLEVARAKETLALLTNGDVSGLSVGLSVDEADVKRQEDGWLFTKVQLAEISLVAVPADSEARISTVASVRSLRDFERFLRDAGFARQFAAKLASRGWPNEKSEQSEINAAVARIRAGTAAIKGTTQ